MYENEEIPGSNPGPIKHKNNPDVGGLFSTEVAFLLLTQQPQVRFPALPKIYINVAVTYQQRWLEENGQRLENVDRTHLVLASGKLVLQKDPDAR